ncbi:MAG TPA: chromosome partitioning protein [Opitutae bacterium]|nr:chromosome partitioning protein [Opitutaceae bacterium]HCR30129.1 chromosome partitioning protein [Opitutae bacterium]
MSKEAIKNALSTVKYPGFSRDIVSFGLVRSVEFQDGKAQVGITVTTNDHSIAAQIRDSVESALNALPEVDEVEVSVSINASNKPSGAGETQESNPLGGVKHVIAVASGKGGVGKSTFSSNLACALSALLSAAGKRVGLLDCDIYGPSIPLMMGINQRPEIEEETILPLENHGISIMSMGFLIDEDTPVVWRGPMIQKTISQFADNVKWGNLEVIVVDLPPGTGDAQLSLAQTIPLSGAIIVTTPQLASTQVAKRGARMLEKTNVPILGVVENMSYFLDPNGEKLAIFGEGGGEKTAEELETQFLGSLPLDPEIRKAGDKGTPLTLANKDSQTSKSFQTIAEKILQKLGQQ